MPCLKCGLCCLEYKIILITHEEAKKKLFKTKRHPDPFNSALFSNRILKTKKKWVSLLGRVEEVCCYFNGMTNLCLIHLNKPYACRGYFCKKGKQIEE